MPNEPYDYSAGRPADPISPYIPPQGGQNRQASARSTGAEGELGRAVSELAGSIRREVAPALRGAGREVGAAMRQVGKQMGPAMQQAGESLRRAAEQARAAQTAQAARQQALRLGQAERRRMGFNRFLAQFGGGFCAFWSVFFASCSFLMLDGGVEFGAAFMVLAMAVGAGFGAFSLLRKAGRWKRARRYRDFLSGWAGCTLKELSGSTGKSVEYLQKDLQTLIGGRYLRGAFLDARDQILFADEASYREYLDERRAREQAAKARREEEARRAAAAAEPARPAHEEFCEEAGSFLQQLSALRAEIADPLVLEQADQLAQVVGEIRDWVAGHPASLPKVKRLTGYYLPTTLKLLRTYTSVDSNPGPTAQNICQNITGILHTFNTGLLTMQDSLLEDTALDVSAEISVLESMLQQEGLTGTADFAPLALRGEPEDPEAGEAPRLELPGGGQ